MNFWQFIVQNHTEVLDLTWEHISLVGISMLIAVLIGIPLGILITRWPALNKPVLGGANIIQTFPAWHFLDFCCRCPGSARVPAAWRFLPSPFIPSYR